MPARDGLLWIGHSYLPFDCGSTGECLADSACFVHEAVRRGISRKLPAVPEWAAPGETRIFLAHRDGHTTPDLGKIYGYFVLQRIEVIDDTGSRSAGVWQPPCPETENVDQVMDAIVEHLWDGALNRNALTLAPLAAERLTDERCYRSGEHRTGWRESSGAVYAVDALCADVTDAWAELVRCSREPDFARLLHRLHEPDGTSRRPVPETPAGIAANVRAGLVLFVRPPEWQAFPVASCQSLIRVDGDHLLEQVKTGQRRVKVRRHATDGSRRAVEVALACECGVNLELAHRFVSKLLDMGYRSGRIEKYRFIQDELAEARVWIRTSDDFSIEKLADAIELGESQLAGRRDELRDKCAAMLEEMTNDETLVGA